MNIKHFLLSIGIIFCITASAQDQVVNDAALPESEFHTAINPLDSNNMVIASQYDFGNEFSLTIYYTHDFGETWSISDYNGFGDNATLAGDAVLDYDAEGNVYLVNLTGTFDGMDVKTIMSKSTDGGATWTPVSTIVSPISDKPWLAIDRYAGSPYIGNFYVPVVVNSLELYILDEAYNASSITMGSPGNHLPSVVVSRDGTVFTSHVDMSDPNVVVVQQYDNGGTELVHSTSVVSFPNFMFSAPDVSTRFQPTAYLAIDNSGSVYDGRLYLSYTASEVASSSYFNVFLTYSDDDGLTWSTPSVVHSDQEPNVQQFYSSLFVNDNGVLVIDWYDRKDYVNTTLLTDFYMGVSHDGGSSFEEVKLTTTPSDFNFVISASEGFGIGEYHQMVAADHHAISFWTDGRSNDGDLNIYMAKVNIDGVVGIEEQTVVSSKYSFSSLYPLPANSNIYSDINLKKPATITYKITDEQGATVHLSGAVKYPVGSHQLSIDFDLAAGVYLVTIMTEDGYYKTMKMIIQ